MGTAHKPMRRLERIHIASVKAAVFLVIVYAVVAPIICTGTVAGELSLHSDTSISYKAARSGCNNNEDSKVCSQRSNLGDGHATVQHTHSPELRKRLNWQTFWNSELEAGVRSSQELKHSIDMFRDQAISKGSRATGGLDMLMADQLAQLSTVTNLTQVQAWIREEVTVAVFQALHDLQHPADCRTARALVCSLDKPCGFGCQIHHAVHCLAHALALNRTLALHVFPTNYITSETSWDEQLLPVGKCQQEEFPAASQGILHNKYHDEERVVFMDTMDDVGASEFDPPTMPQDVLEAVQLFNSRPSVWWTGVLLSYLLRPSDQALQRQAAFRKAHNWPTPSTTSSSNLPIVGVHVRRTDKIGDEADLYHVEQYMQIVEHYCDVKLKSGWQKRAKELQMKAAAVLGNNTVNGDIGSASSARHSECSTYIASDEPAVVQEIRERYPHIHIISNEQGIATGAPDARYSTDGFIGVLDDMLHLANTDFLVGTFSSQVSRCAYEISQVNNTGTTADMALQYQSLDSAWYFGGQAGYLQCLASDYTAKGVVVAKAGAKLDCPAIHDFDGTSGMLKCSRYGSKEIIQVPPGLVVDCVPDNDNEWNILPEHMRRPGAQTSVESWRQ